MKINAYGHVGFIPIATKADDRYIQEYGLELDKETGNTKVVPTNKIDTVEIIQSYKDQVGIEAIKRIINAGLHSKEFFMDHGNQSGDCSALATDFLDAHDKLLSEKEKLNNMAASFGIESYTDAKDLEEKILASIKAKAAAEVEKKEGAN